MAQLRSVFVEHGVAYPSHHTKVDLVVIFNSEIRPRARQLLEEKLRHQPAPERPTPLKVTEFHEVYAPAPTISLQIGLFIYR